MRKTIKMKLFVRELVYDIQNKTYLTGRSRQTGTNHEQVANMQANDDDENANQILRSIQNAFGTLKTKLSEWLDEEGTTATDELMSMTYSEDGYFKAVVSPDGVTWVPSSTVTGVNITMVDKIDDLPSSGVADGTVYYVKNTDTVLNVSLIMPCNYNSSTRETVNSALHQYIVNMAIGDWFNITNKADAADYYTLASSNLETMREAANKRIRPVRRNIVGE